MQSMVLSRESISSVYALVVQVSPLFTTSSFTQSTGIHPKSADVHRQVVTTHNQVGIYIRGMGEGRRQQYGMVILCSAGAVSSE